ncbi:DUF4405 domain-containing protein [Acidimangrovimonas sediminis]|uniref:DUF4405 domain-containing protein n=1 Tax=Acidimangrovimonas sediminis TaxID=2056283 RepID=UPI000C809BBE|nr:DUF4405 domain-containing protein [Acidimangrovimonas sediminis]
MTVFFNRYSTPLIAGLFAVSLISGIALFFHWGSAYFHSMHEWLSMVLIAPFILHLWKNWRPLLRYLRGAPFAIAMGLSLLAALAFIVPTGGISGGPGRRSGPPQFALSQKVMGGTVTEMAAVLDETPEGLTARLQKAGFIVSDPEQKLSDVTIASQKSDAQMAAALSTP